MRIHPLPTIAVTALLLLPQASDLAGAEPTGLERRDALVTSFQENKADILPQLEAALDDEDPLVRRTAVHLLRRLEQPPENALLTASKDVDYEVRRIALDGLLELGTLPGHLERVLADDHPSVRRHLRFLFHEHPWLIATRVWSLEEGQDLEATLVDEVTAIYGDAPEPVRRELATVLAPAVPLPPEARRLLTVAAGEEMIDELSRHGLEWQEHQDFLLTARTLTPHVFRETVLQIRWEQPAEDRVHAREELERTSEVLLPEDGWRFKIDPERIGHRDGWFQADWDDREWREVEIAQAWHNFLDDRYVGAGWYRRDIEVPGLQPNQVALLHFEGVDESGWVWINGQFVGRHDVGPNGWRVPFWVDITDFLQPGESNQLTVRVRNTAYAGGIFRPVRLQIYE